MSDTERERLRTRLNALFEARTMAATFINDPYLGDYAGREIHLALGRMVTQAAEELRAHDARTAQMAKDTARAMRNLLTEHVKLCQSCMPTMLCEVGENMSKAATLAEAYEVSASALSEIEQDIRRTEGDGS